MKKWLVAAILLYALPLIAQTYEWTDEQGTTNFTEDLGKVPKKYRKKAKLVGSDDGGAAQVTEESAPAKEKGEPKSKESEAQGEQKLYGGKDEKQWRTDFRAANADLKGANQEIRDLQARLADTSNMSRGEYLSVQGSLKHAEFRRQEMAKKLETLKSQADKAGVPAELRQ